MILAILGLLPVVPKLVLGVERLFGHGSGTSKKQSVMSDISALLNAFSQAASTSSVDSSAMAFMDDFVEATVRYFNSNGTMTHGVGVDVGVVSKKAEITRLP